MKALGYLFFTNIKNSIKELKKHPSRIITLLLVIALVGIVFFSSTVNKQPVPPQNPVQLYAMVFGLYLILFLLGVFKGFTSGASFFSMSDVNFLFVSPISSKRILIYGLIKQMGTSLLVAFFLLFQFAWLNQLYGLTVSGLIYIILGYCVVVFSSQVTAMAIYSFISGNEKRRRILKGVLIALILVLAGYVIVQVLPNRLDLLGSISNAANAQILTFVPVVGWIKASVIGAMTGNLMPILLGVGATILYIAGILLAIIKSRSEYYEDVLLATEVSHSAITAKKEGKFSDTPTGKIRLGKTGLRHGKGASAFFYKHMIENRRARLFILDMNSLIFLAVTWVFSYFMRENTILMIFIFATYMQIFSSMLGRWIKELTLPYVYLSPQRPFIKLVNICKENLIKVCIEAVLLFVPIGIIMSAGIDETITCILARIGFGVLFMAGNIFIERLLGSVTNKTVTVMLYFIIMIVLAIPGILFGVLFAGYIHWMPFIPSVMSICFVWNMLVSIVIGFCCRNILNYAELNNR